MGANIGPICIPAVRTGYVNHAIAFEPDPENFRLLRINAILNDVDSDIEFHQVALGSEIGQAQLALSLDNHGDHRILPANAAAPANSVAVSVRCLDDYIDGEADVEPILWIDVQGYEMHVLCGAPSALAKACPLTIEYSPKDLKRNGTLNGLVELLTTGAYSKFYDLEQESPSQEILDSGNLIELARTLEARDTFTDILIL